jgi:hypothetical protein
MDPLIVALSSELFLSKMCYGITVFKYIKLVKINDKLA